ncbi:TPA: hypothetical protein ACTW52_003708 [Klebsiella quasipneumoniae subsp. similipneumoniae]|uniref:hypothetical protein n=1 Tax=Klebsiella pneumoniae complex TaxID=3390273 RepID=UPI000C7B0503|nr:MULTISPECIES: hypothetical protein [Klebsiella]MDE9344820.1 hypothetical protein [Klebsiella variicola]MEB5580493.1 hypothetical protein [Klebsiella quasipneumoniae]MEB5743130.1 hypothetical protein [Klebsiella quasipneumoniae]MEC4471209.1 hypothetical protein [Klebsiella pneumoniae]PLC79674.1 hypothetical protein B6I40_02620 [Klebsiella variicola]
MFQISAGGFFDSHKIEKHEGTFVFYSNVDVFFPVQNELPFFKVKQVSHDGVNCYVVNYILLTEKPDKIEAGVVTRAGDQDYIQQFILIWEFYFDCVARLEKESVKKICAQSNFNKNHSKIVLEIAPHLVEINRPISSEDVNGFLGFVQDVVSIKRSAFKSVMAALKIISDSKESLSTNFDLTYSMLVYALESLSQRNDNYQSRWDDYDQKMKAELELVFENLPYEDSVKIKNILIGGKQFKLQKRFKDFITSNIGDEYFYETGKRPIRSSFLNRALDNLYKIRSSFVHELKPLDKMMSNASKSTGDCLVLFGEPYFSYSGLLRLLGYVIKTFCKNNHSNENESVNWVMETSGMMVAEISAMHWLWNPEAFTSKSIARWFSEYLNMLNSNRVTDLQAIMCKIEEVYDQSKREHKSGLLSFYFLYNYVHNKDKREWLYFAEKRYSFLERDMYWYVCCAYMYSSLTSIANAAVDASALKEFNLCFNEYERSKFKPGRLNLPAMTEAAVLICAANSYFRIGMYQDYVIMVKRSLREVSTVQEVFNYIRDCLSNSQSIDLLRCFDLYREGEAG